MTPPHDIDDDLAAELTQLVDGVLPEGRRTALEARLDADPALREQVAAQRAAAERIRAAAVDVGAPARLRARIEAQRSGGARGRAREPRRRWSLGLGLGLAATAAVAVLAVVLALPAGAPTVAEAAELGTRPPEAGAPPPEQGRPALLAEEQDGVPFPNWTAKFGWRATGSRTDEVDGRETTTVFYENEKGDRQAAYTIVGGEALEEPEGGRVVTRGGVEYRVLREDGRTVVTWEREGHTCVMSAGPDADAAKLVELADWRGKGGVPF